MRAIKPNTRRRSAWRSVLLAIVAIVGGGAVTVGALAALKVIDPAKLAFWKSKEIIYPKDWIGVPISIRAIPAYTMVTRDYLIDPKTSRWALSWMSPKEVPEGVITDTSKIRGRVAAREKPAGYLFSENDFLPKGTRPGVVGGTPEGKRAITLDASKLKGVFDLREGDHVDLLDTVSVDMPGAGHSNTGRMGTNVVATPDAALLPKRGLVKALVQDGVVVTPVKFRNVPTASSSLTQGTTTRNIPVQEIVLAVEPKEVAPLAAAMAMKYEITCVARSGRPAPLPSPAAHAPPPGKGKTANRSGSETAAKESAALDITPGLDPMDEVRFMEVMIGAQRQFVLFSGPGNSPVVAAQDDGSAKTGAGAVPAATE